MRHAAVCRDFQRGLCRFATKCRFFHPVVPCAHFRRPEGCRRGVGCRFSHAARAREDSRLRERAQREQENALCTAFYRSGRNYQALAYHLQEALAVPRDLLHIVRDYACAPPAVTDAAMQKRCTMEIVRCGCGECDEGRWFAHDNTRVAAVLNSRCHGCDAHLSVCYPTSSSTVLQLCACCLEKVGLTSHDPRDCKTGTACSQCQKVRVKHLQTLPTAFGAPSPPGDFYATTLCSVRMAKIRQMELRKAQIEFAEEMLRLMNPGCDYDSD